MMTIVSRSSRRTSTVCRGTGLLVLFCAVLGAARPVLADGTRMLTLDEALAIAGERNRDIQKAKEYRNQVMGRYVEERSAALPSLKVSGGISRQYDGSAVSFPGQQFSFARQDVKNAGIEVTQALFTWGKVGAAIRAAKVGLQTADEQLRLYRQAAAKDVSDAFYTVLLGRDLQTLAHENSEQKKRHLDEAHRKHAAGVATDYDVLAAEVGLENARPDVVRTTNELRIARDRLRFLLGVEDDVDAVGTLDTPPDCSTDFAEALATAEKRRPELVDLRLRGAVADELVKIANAEDKPRLDLKGGYRWNDVDYSKNLHADGPQWTIGLTMTWPLFDGLKTRGKVAQERSVRESLRIDEAKLRDSIGLEIREAISRVTEAREIAAGLAGTVRQAERLLSMAEQGYELGVKNRLDVDDAQFNLVQAKSSLARAKKDLNSACVNMDWVKGTLEAGEGRGAKGER